MPREMSKSANLMIGIGIGAGFVYLLDPVNGKRRRTRIRDKFVRLSHMAADGAEAAARDIANRTRGMAAAVNRAFQKLDADDPVLEARVRSEMGRRISHPHAIHIEAKNGRVVLSGDILVFEEKNFLHHVAQVPGVKKVENRLRMHELGENFSNLKGGTQREARFEYFQTHWAPGPRLLAALSGAAMVGSGIRNRGLGGWGISVLGALLFIRAVRNVEFMRLIEGKEAAGKKEEEKVKPSESGVSIPITRKKPSEYQVH